MAVSAYHAVGIFLLLVAPICGAIIPVVFQANGTLIHFLQAYAGGILLGFALLHLMADAVEEVPAIQSVNEGYPIAGLLIGCTLLLLIFIANFVQFMANFFIVAFIVNKKEKVTPRTIDVLGFAPGMLIHGIFEGLAWGIGIATYQNWVALTILFFHKCVEFNALATMMVMAEFSYVTLCGFLFIVQIPCVISFIVAWKLTEVGTADVQGYFAAFACGTFLYLSLCHLIPEAMCTLGNHTHPELSTKNAKTSSKIPTNNKFIKKSFFPLLSSSSLSSPPSVENIIEAGEGNSCCPPGECECDAPPDEGKDGKDSATVIASAGTCRCGINNNKNNINNNNTDDDFYTTTSNTLKIMNSSYFTQDFLLKTNGYLGVGLGFATFALLELAGGSVSPANQAVASDGHNHVH